MAEGGERANAETNEGTSPSQPGEPSRARAGESARAEDGTSSERVVERSVEEAPRTAPDEPPSVAPLSDEAPPSIPSAAVLSDRSAPQGSVSSDVKVLPGHVLAQRYQVLSVLGEGGMGIVYRCRDLSTGDDVAIKRVIPPDGKLADDYVAWFYKEARALAALNHPSIVRARDFGQLADGSPYLGMELVSGVSLHDLSQVRLSFALIWSIIDQVLGALAHAHARGIVHGDLKPSNILVEEVEGAPPMVHILDFGLAWLKQDPHDERLDGSKAMEFTPHAGAGTPGYMAPEQIQHEMHHVCGATDLYSLGCALYKMLCGRSPFRGTAKELLKQHAFEAPPEPQLIIPEAPQEISAFLLRLLAKRPWDRYEFANEARVAWSAWRPSSDLAEEAWRFPQLKTTGPAPSIRKSGADAPSGELPRAATRAPGLLSIRPSPIVGRDEIRTRLREVCDQVVDLQGPSHRLVILVGSAGVGKSRIAEWLCEAVHEEGSMIALKARYRSMRGALDGMVGGVVDYYNFERADRDTIERSLLSRWKVSKADKNGRAWVAGAAEWLRPTPADVERPLGPSGVRFTLDTLEVRRLVTRYTLRRIARGRPLLFWLDDLHQASEATFDGLLKLHTDDPDQRIVMVATVRSEDVQVGAPAAERIRELREALDGEVIEVNAMDPDTTQALLKASLPLNEAAVAEAARRSRGNPLFALQQLHAWALGGEMEYTDSGYRVPDEVLALRPKTTAELWDQRLDALPEEHRLGALALATLGADLRRDIILPLLSALGVPAQAALASMQRAEVILPRGAGRYSWPHALLQEHLLLRLNEREDARRVFETAAQSLVNHPQANTRRVIRLRVHNLLEAGQPDNAASLLFSFLNHAWSGAREPRATLADLDLLKQVTGRSLALKHRWRAEALRHVGKPEEATIHAEIARTSFEEAGDNLNMAHCLRLLGHLASERGQSAEGLMLVQLARDLFAAEGDVPGQAQCEAVIGEIEYLLGNYERTRQVVEEGARHFESVAQPLGRGQCLLLLSWVDHSEGHTERSRRRTLEARAEFERAGYRLGIAQADASLAHLEHRLMNFYSAELGATDALSAFEALGNVRGQAACERLLAMVGIDTDDLDMAEIHAELTLSLFEQLDDPWGRLEATLLQAQVALGRGDLERAEGLLIEAAQIRVEEAEPRQHFLLTRAWLLYGKGRLEGAEEALELASEVFGERSRGGDHTPHLLGRLSRLPWPAHVEGRIAAWHAQLVDRARRHVS
ncbi:MAG: protein kinase [Polyangiaceae bacterium]|nr:protein kinase [Polyangiaceae bacterium]MCW5789208.1 protein kinase [Polyangiaceae bacterium]